MSDVHLSRDLLRAAARGDLAPRKLMDIGLDHLLAVCPHCRQEYEAWHEERSRTGPGLSVVLPALLRAQTAGLAREEERADQDVTELLALSQAERFARVRRARRRFRGAALVRRLLAESDRLVRNAPGEAFHLAELARAIVQETPRLPGCFDLIALTTAYMANARRVGGTLREADEHMGFARHVISKHGVTDSHILARIDELEGSLRKDERRFDQAEVLLDRAILLYRLSGATAAVGRVALVLGATYYHAGRLKEAVDVTRSALHRLAPTGNSYLYLCGRYNLALFLTEAGLPSEAADLLAADRELYQAYPDAWTQLRRRWLEGKIAVGKGRFDVAESAFLEARTGFLQQGDGWDAALVSLDLALVYLERGRTTELRRLAEEMVPIFSAEDVHREAAAALRLFAEAIRRERLSTGLVRELVTYLRAAKVDPTLAFENMRSRDS